MTAALSLAVLNLLARPILLLALSPLPAFTVQVAELLVEIVIVLAIGRFVPGVGVANMGAAIWDAVALTILNALFAEVLRASDDDSYHGSQVRRLELHDATSAVASHRSTRSTVPASTRCPAATVSSCSR